MEQQRVSHYPPDGVPLRHSKRDEDSGATSTITDASAPPEDMQQMQHLQIQQPLPQQQQYQYQYPPHPTAPLYPALAGPGAPQPRPSFGGGPSTVARSTSASDYSPYQVGAAPVLPDYETSQRSTMSGDGREYDYRPRSQLADLFNAGPPPVSRAHRPARGDLRTPLQFGTAYGGRVLGSEDENEDEGAPASSSRLSRATRWVRELCGGCMRGSRRGYHRLRRTPTYVAERLASGANITTLLNEGHSMSTICEALPDATIENLLQAGLRREWTHDGTLRTIGADGWGTLIGRGQVTSGMLSKLELRDFSDCLGAGMSAKNLTSMGLTVPVMMTREVEHSDGTMRPMLDRSVLEKYAAHIPVQQRLTPAEWTELGLEPTHLQHLQMHGNADYQSLLGIHPSHLAYELKLWDGHGPRNPEAMRLAGLEWEGSTPAPFAPAPASAGGGYQTIPAPSPVRAPVAPPMAPPGRPPQMGAAVLIPPGRVPRARGGPVLSYATPSRTMGIRR